MHFALTDEAHRTYPVVDGDGALIGVVSRSDALRWQREPDVGVELLKDKGVSSSVTRTRRWPTL